MRLRNILLNKFISLQLIIVILSIFLCIDLFFKAEDTLHESFLHTEVNAVLEAYQQNKQVHLPQSSTLKSFAGIHNVPEKYQPLISHLPTGIYELSVEGTPGFKEEQEIRVAIASINASRPYLYFISSLPDSSGESLLTKDMLWLMLFYFSIVVAFGLWFSWILSKKASIPLETLSSAVSNNTLSKEMLNDEQAADEINALSQAIVQRQQRIDEFIRREKNTMRNISHELRTPVTVLSSSLSLLKNRNETITDQHKMLLKMQRAINDVMATMDAFLWLGREHNDQEEYISDGTVAVNKAIERYKNILDEKPVKLVLTIEKSVSIQCKDAIFYIVVANLIRNAFSYTDKGTISISLMHNIFSISDTGPGMATTQAAKNDQSFGYGLDIVRQICEQMRWCFNTMPNDNGQGTQALVSFH